MIGMGKQIGVEVVIVPYEGMLKIVTYTLEVNASELLIEHPGIPAIHKYVERRNHSDSTLHIRLLRQGEAVVYTGGHRFG